MYRITSIKLNVKWNKRPRGLNDLLDHLLVKRMPVMHKLSSAKIPEEFNSKVDTRSSKAGKAPNNPKLNLTVKSTMQALKTYL